MTRLRALVFAAGSILGIHGPHAHGQTPSLQIQRDRSDLVLVFSGTLLSAESPLGPWSTLSNAISPFRLNTPSSPASPDARYFRTLSPASPAGGLFDGQDIAAWSLSGPLQQHFELAHAGMPDGIFPPVREKPYFTGTISFAGTTLPAQLRVRGNSSLQECPFPKLKVKIAREHRTNTPFAEAREVKIGTHCAEGGRGPIGRLREETACYREALAYEITATLQFLTPRVRRAVVDYQDQTPASGPDSPVGWQLRRKAFLLEDPEVLAERLGGRALDDAEIAVLTQANFPAALIVELRMLHALLGNWDFALSESGEGLWNTDVVAAADGRLTPIPGDFDLASLVTGEVRLEAPHDYRPDLPDLDRQMRFKLEELRTRAGADAFALSTQRFLLHREELEDLVRTSIVDDEGRQLATHHLALFFSLLTEGTR